MLSGGVNMGLSMASRCFYIVTLFVLSAVNGHSTRFSFVRWDTNQVSDYTVLEALTCVHILITLV